MDPSVQQVVSAARAEAARMMATVENTDKKSRIMLTTDQFAALAKLIGCLGEMLAQPHPGSFGEARYWVPLDAFKRAQAIREAVEQECQTLRETVCMQQLVGGEYFPLS